MINTFWRKKLKGRWFTFHDLKICEVEVKYYADTAEKFPRIKMGFENEFFWCQGIFLHAL